MFCPFCGTQQVEGARFCADCGKELPRQTVQSAPKDEWPEEKTAQKSVWVWLGTALFAVALAAAAVFVILWNMDEPEPDPLSPGKDDAALAGCWVVESDRSHVRRYYEFLPDGTGYCTLISYDEETGEYYYNDASVTRILSWNFDKSYGIQMQELNEEGERYTYAFADEDGEEDSYAFHWKNDDYFVYTLWGGLWHFQRLEYTLLPYSAKLAAE